MATTLTAMPSVITAGDSLIMLQSVADYPATSWTLTYTFRKKDGSPITFASTASGSNHSFSIAADTTASWGPGTYKGMCRATDGTSTETIWSGWLTILPDLSQQPDNYDTRSHAQKCLDSINAVLEGKSTRDAIATTIAGQSISRMSFDELLRAKSYYESVVAAELAKEALANGQSTNTNVLIRFNQA